MKRITLFLLILCAAMMMGVLFASAAPQDGYSIDWWSIDGGGESSHGNGYSLGSVIGEPDAGLTSGDGYTLIGGIWSSTGADFRLFLPNLMR